MYINSRDTEKLKMKGKYSSMIHVGIEFYSHNKYRVWIHQKCVIPLLSFMTWVTLAGPRRVGDHCG